jgi:hypothetical protein
MRVAVITVALCFLVFEAYARIFLRRTLGPGTVSLGMYQFDPTLGWTPNNGEFEDQSADFSVKYAVVGNHRRTPSSSRCEAPEIAVFGDSFVFGIGVNDADTIPNQLAQRTRSCVSNEGVPGYGPDQYFLRWQKDDHKAKCSVFVLFTGNDYKDILADKDAGGARKKPLLQPRGGSYSFSFPETAPTPGDRRSHFLRSDDFARFLAKQSPVLIGLRKAIVSADGERVDAALGRIDFLLSQMDLKRSLFVVMPSASLVRGISTSTDEGLFRDGVVRLFQSRSVGYLDLYEQRLLRTDDYFPNEGHTRAEAHARIAASIASFVRENRCYER